MSTGKVILISIIVSAITSAATFFGLRAATGDKIFADEAVLVPPLTRLSPDQARKLLEPKGLMLIVAERREDPKMEPGLVIAQTPLEGSKVKRGAEVKVVISTGQNEAEVPSLAKLPLTGAVQLLSRAGFQVGTTTRQSHDEIPKDHLITSAPPPGQKAAKGTQVNLVVSDGPEGVEVPKVVLQGLNRAKEAITKAGLDLGKVTYASDEDRRPGLILRQTPAAGEKAPKGSKVDLVVNMDDY